MEQWLTFVEDRWVFIVIALIVLFIVMKIVHSAVKWLIVLAIVAGIWFYGSNYTEQIKDIGSQLMDFTKAEAVEALIGESMDAQYEGQADGTYTITTKNFLVEGEQSSDEAKITFKGQTFTIKLTDTLNKFIEAARNNKSV